MPHDAPPAQPDEAAARTGRHIRIATVNAPLDQAVAHLEATDAETADWVEIRLDALWRDVPDPDAAAEHLLQLLEAARIPVLATLRPTRQGGGFQGDEALRRNLLAAAAQAGCHAVDLEDDDLGIAPVARALRDMGAELVLSDHRFPACPGRDPAMRHLQSMQDLHGTLDKLAFPVGSFMDGLRSLELAHAHAARHGAPAIAPIGGGPLLRALLPLAGNHATYGHAPGAEAAVPGQPGMQDVAAIWDHWGIGQDELPGDPDAGWYAVLGHPVEHSLSPRIHNAQLRRHGDEARFGALDVPDSIGAMRLLASVASRIGLRGASITMPLKRHAFDVGIPDAIAQAAGAVNCMRFDPDGSAHGTNTDATAMQRLLWGHDTVAVFGAGGAARATIAAAHARDMRATFISRDPDRAAKVAADTGATWVPWDERDRIVADAWVQATPRTDVTAAGLDGEFGIELVYGHGRTDFQRRMATCIDGRRFLVEQALDAYRFLTGRDADAELMTEALP